MVIRPVLDALLETLQRVNAPLASQLVTGLDPELITARLATLPKRVAVEVHDYFAWRNGMSLERTREEELFPEAVMLSLEEALAEHEMLRGVAEQVSRQAGVPSSSIWDDRWVPLFRHPGGGAYYVTVAGDEPAEHAPIWTILQEDPSSAAIAFDSLATLAATVNECFTTGAYRANEGTIEEDRQRAAEIIRKLNPARVESATEWLPPNN